MTTPFATTEVDTTRPPARALTPAVAPVALGFAALLGIAGDVLMVDGPIGVGFPLWTALIAASLFALAWRAELALPRETLGWLAVAAVCDLGLAWRDSEILQFFDILATLGALVLAAASLNRPGSMLFAPRLIDAAVAVIDVVRSAALGFFRLVMVEATAADDQGRARTNLLRGGKVVLIAVPLLVVFGSLLRSADPIFASFTNLESLDLGLLVRHTIVILVLSAGVAGWARAALLPKLAGAPRGPQRVHIGALEITAALGTLDVLFAAFLAAQLGWLFGGEAFLQARTGLTAAEYARRGFFQMVWVVALVLPLIVVTRAALGRNRALAWRHTVLSVPLVALLAAMIVSAALRMKLYVHYYGLSVDRLFTLVFMTWLGMILAWTALTVLRGWTRPFLAGVVLSGVAALAALNLAAPDRIVARVNLSRATATVDQVPLDVAYLSTLSGEAADIAVAAVLNTQLPTARAASENPHTARCTAARRLIQRWGPWPTRCNASTSWRSWNAGQARAVAAVSAHATELRNLARDECRLAKEAADQR